MWALLDAAVWPRPSPPFIPLPSLCRESKRQLLCAESVSGKPAVDPRRHDGRHLLRCGCTRCRGHGCLRRSRRVPAGAQRHQWPHTVDVPHAGLGRVLAAPAPWRHPVRWQQRWFSVCRQRCERPAGVVLHHRGPSGRLSGRQRGRGGVWLQRSECVRGGCRQWHAAVEICDSCCGSEHRSAGEWHRVHRL